MELMDTVTLMNSSSYKERFKAEYYQLDIRIKKLTEMLAKYEAKVLDFELTSPELLMHQLESMKIYRFILEERAKVENVELD